IYVADTNNNRIQKFDSSGTYVSQFGRSGSGDGQFRVPQGIFVDNYNRILVSDTGNHRIQQFDISGNFVLSFGSFGTGAEQFKYPQQITMDGLRGFVADTNNNRIWSFYFPEPPIADEQRVSTTEETPISITLTATDANNDSLTYSVVSSPIHGILTGTAPLLTYSPNPDYFGTDSFTFKANDGSQDSNVATILIDIGNINDPPTSNSQAVTTNEDTQLAITATASDPEGDALEFIMINTVQHGTISGTLPNVIYTPELNHYGSDSFLFKVNDGLVDSITSTISITINPVNDPPIAYDVNATLNEDTSIYTSSIPYQQSDVENDSLSLIIVSSLSHGTLSGDLTDLIYTPDPNYYGMDCLTFKFNDGEFDSNVATGCAIILPVNDPPVADAQSIQTDEDIPIDITLTGADVENDSLTYQIVSQPSHGILSGDVPNITYTPDQNEHGLDSFTFRVYDGSEYSTSKIISITINPVNDSPVAHSMNFTTAEDTPFVNTIPVAADDEDSPLTYILISPPSHGTLSGDPPFMTYTPDLDYFGSDSLQFMVNDGELDSNIATLYMAIGPVNDQPTTFLQSLTTDEDIPLDVILQASDPDNDSLEYEIVHNPPHGLISGTLPNVTYTPNQNYYGTDNFSFKVNDGISDSNTSTISITINPINDVPIIHDVDITTQEDTPYQGMNEYLKISSDVEDDPLTFVLLSPPTHGVLSGTIGNLTYTPTTNYFGSDCVMFKANDGKIDSNVASACMTIQSVNDPPVADDQQIAMESNTLQSITLTATDVEDDPLSYVIVSSPAHGTLFGLAPEIKYLPNRNYIGIDTFTFKADDGNATSVYATISLTINQSTEQQTEQQTTSTGNSNSFTIPRISKVTIDTESGNSLFYDFTGSINTLRATTGEKITLQATLDDVEASKGIIHFGMYTNIRKTTSDIKHSNAYVVFDIGSPLKVVDTDKIFKDIQLDTSYRDKSMIVDITFTFDKPMKESDIILEVWNQGRHPRYETIQSSLIVESSDYSESNVSGSVVMAETKLTEPIRVFSTAGGKIIEVKNNGVLTLKTKDVGIKIDGFIENSVRRDKIDLMILGPDDSVYKTSGFVNRDNSYSVIGKLNTKWASGFYDILVSYNEKEIEKIRFFVTDKEMPDGQYPAILSQPEKISAVSQYLNGNMTKEKLSLHFQNIGWSESRINDFIANNSLVQTNPYTFYILAGLIPLLYVLVSVLSTKKTL
ncbi:Ig-like domain-containing protein, partial [Nitrosopumilus sp.]